MRHFLKTLLLGGTLLFSSAQADVTELRYATAAPEKTPWGAYVLKTIAAAEKDSGNTLKINPFFSSALGDEQTVIRQTVRGRIDLSAQSGVATSLIVPEIALLGAPYLFETPEQSDCVFDNHVQGIFGKMLDDKGLVLLSYVEVGHGTVFSKDPIPDAMAAKALKIRVPPSNATQVFWNAVGAAGVPMGVVDMIPALKTGQVKAIHTAAVYGVAIGLHKLAPNIIFNRMAHDVGTVTVSKKVWRKLNDQQRSALRNTASMMPELRTAIRGAEMAMMKKAAGEGANVLQTSGSAHDSWKAHAGVAQAALVEKIGGRAPEIWEKVQAAVKSCAAG